MSKQKESTALAAAAASAEVGGEWDSGVMRASQAAAGRRDGVWFQSL